MEGPRRILYQLSLLKYEKKAVAGTVLPTIQRLSLFAFSEMELQTRLCCAGKTKKKEKQGSEDN